MRNTQLENVTVQNNVFNGIETEIPLILKPSPNEIDVETWCLENRQQIRSLLNDVGAILLRGFKIGSAEMFEKLVKIISSDLIEYKERSSPRTHVKGNVYTSTEYPSDREIFLHNEQSYNWIFPKKIFFYCEKEPDYKGNTPIADTRNIYRRIVESVEASDLPNEYLLKRFYRPHLGLDWREVFQTSSKDEVEKYCKENDIKVGWKEDGCLTTSQVRPCIANHPETNSTCWFNHCAFFNVNSLEEEVKEMLLLTFPQEELPTHTYYADGTKFSKRTMEIIQQAYISEKTTFDWKQDDLLILDNILTSHGRSSFKGERRILAAMSEPCDWSIAKT